MDFARVSEFVEIARAGSLSAAAQTLGVPAATLSARMKSLEKSLGVGLFDRRGRSLALTAAGQRFLPHAQQIVQHYDNQVRELHALQRHAYRRLRIALSGPGTPLHLGPFLDQLNETFPQLKLELVDAAPHALAGSLCSGEIDLFFINCLEYPLPPEIARRPFAAPAHYVLLPHTHPMARENRVSLRELDGGCFILYPHTAESCERNFQLANLNASGIRYTVYDSETSQTYLPLLVPIGKGILISPYHLLEPPPGTVCLPLIGLSQPAQPFLFHLKAPANPDVLPFAEDYLAFTRRSKGLISTEVRHDH